VYIAKRAAVRMDN